MAKPRFQDIIPPDKRSIKKIPLPERRRPPTEPAATMPEPSKPDVFVKTTRRNDDLFEQFEKTDRPAVAAESLPPRPRKRRGSPIKVISVFILAAALIVGAMYVVTESTTAKVTVTPKQEEVSVDSQLTAVKEVVEGALQFETVTISKDGRMAVTASGQEYVNEKATGTIVIYNNYSAASQRLIASTRFQTNDGLIFRITQPVNVPGKSGSTPGSIEAPIVADEPGPKYNVGLKDFTIPGFKGDPRHEEMYARSKIPVQGGFTGNRPKVDTAQVDAARTKINGELKTDLISQVEKDIPVGYIMPDNAYVITYESLPNTQDQGGNAQVNQRATLHGIIFKRTALAQEIAKRASGEIKGPVDLADANGLQLILRTGTTTAGIDANQIAFALKGQTKLVAVIDVGALKAELAGKPRSGFNAILSNKPNITKAEVTMRPFWKTVFPENMEAIQIAVDTAEPPAGQ